MINDGILITTNKWPSAWQPRGKKGVEVPKLALESLACSWNPYDWIKCLGHIYVFFFLILCITPEIIFNFVANCEYYMNITFTLNLRTTLRDLMVKTRLQ